MPAQRPRASFEPIAPDFDLKALVESTPNFSYVDRISCDMIDQQGMQAFEKLVTLHVIIGGKPLVIDGFEDRLDPWTFSPKWLRDNCGEQVESARNLTAKDNIPLTTAHYLNNMGLLTNQFFDKPGAYREKGRQRVYLKDIDCHDVWWDKLKDHLPPAVTYLNDSTGEVGGPGAVPDTTGAVPGRRLGKGIARAGDLMSSLPPDMRAQNLMCYIGHEGTYTPAHREMCASLGQNIMVEASNTVSDDGKAEKPGSSIWFMTESKDRHLVSEYWLSVLGHDIEVENHFAQVVAWKKANFNVYVVEQRPGDFILIPPLAPHQVWNRGTRTMKVAWNRTTVETLEMAINEALPRQRIVCRDEQYKNKAIIYYTLQKYASLLTQALTQAQRMPQHDAQQLLYSDKLKQLRKDFKRLFAMYKQMLLAEMFSPDDRDAPKSLEYVPFDSNVTCAYCRGNIFNRFLTCPTCKDLLGHNAEDDDGDPYDVCMDCYAMGRSCACLSGLRWVEQFRWKELATKYENWRRLIIQLDQGPNEKTPLPLLEEKKKYGKKTLTEVVKEQLKRRPFKDVKKPADEPKDDEESDEEIVVGDDGTVKKITKKKSKAWLKNNQPCHVCCHRHPTWKMAKCTTCERSWCYGSLFRGWDKMPIDIMEDQDWSCPHCKGICFAGACRREGKMKPYEPKGTLLGHDTKKVADVRSVEALVDFSVSNLNWLKDDDPVDRTQSKRFQKARAEAEKNKEIDPSMQDEDDDHINETQVEMEYSPDDTPIDPALGGPIPSNSRRHQRDSDTQMSGALQEFDEEDMARRLQQANSSLPPPAAMVAGAPAGPQDGYAPLNSAGYSGYDVPAAQMYPDPDGNNTYHYLGQRDDDSAEPNGEELRPFRKRQREGDDEDGDFEDIAMSKGKKAKKPRLAAAGFRSYDLAESAVGPMASKAKNEVQRQFEKEKERKALEKAKSEGRFIMLQAAIKGKKRIVRLPVPGARLAQVVAVQAAKAALTAAGGEGEDADAEHEVIDAPLRNGDDDDPAGSLLKSDVAPKKNSSRSYEDRVREGKVVSGATKKALIPVEKDDSYSYRARERLPNGKRVVRHSLPATAASSKGKRRQAATEYEEVDIGSGEEDDDFEESGFVAISGARAGSSKNRRSLPGYLQKRHAGDDADLPDQLPDDFRDGDPGERRRQQAKASQNAANQQLQQEASAAQTSSAPGREKSSVGGKRPSMRLAAADPITIEDDDDDDDDEDADDASEMLSQAASGAFAHSNGTTPASKGKVGRPRGRPRKNPDGPTPSKVSAAQAAAQQAQRMMEEENRLAKLQALEMLDDAPFGNSFGGPRAGGNISMADDDLFGDENSDDDEIDVVPARAGMV
ncbi:hypothetical protein M409DRAFT_58931 [Zasmidium cellare ATCC 36951]|uniref:JmjC domain-containing protein n=1 Tax=Zasmidium cellare ATCC 36951 TaxID=1080233 RepID=A0A6A6C323_ZASCE|nr:uncharacterized protein M409DRAFT_58931 [Zasmidium cellare ATCC 36951]KAF2161527.1 hypothetical protein M409DRAFT_58931 [Zasmidium cellare ATCC 36951]